LLLVGRERAGEMAGFDGRTVLQAIPATKVRIDGIENWASRTADDRGACVHWRDLGRSIMEARCGDVLL
jgi:hypothetical protein